MISAVILFPPSGDECCDSLSSFRGGGEEGEGGKGGRGGRFLSPLLSLQVISAVILCPPSDDQCCDALSFR